MASDKEREATHSDTQIVVTNEGTSDQDALERLFDRNPFLNRILVKAMPFLLILKIFYLCFVVLFLIAGHELGHYGAAKCLGVRIQEFSVGVGPILYGVKGTDGIAYNLRVLPIGGFVAFSVMMHATIRVILRA